MSLVFRDGIEEYDIRSHPEWYSCLVTMGGGGDEAAKPASARHPNAIGVATKRAPRRTDDAYWSDPEAERLIAVIDTERAPAFARVGTARPSSAPPSIPTRWAKLAKVPLAIADEPVKGQTCVAPG